MNRNELVAAVGLTLLLLATTARGEFYWSHISVTFEADGTVIHESRSGVPLVGGMLSAIAREFQALVDVIVLTLVTAVVAAVLGRLLITARRRIDLLTAQAGALVTRLAAGTPSSQPAGTPEMEDSLETGREPDPAESALIDTLRPLLFRGLRLLPVGIVILPVGLLFTTNLTVWVYLLLLAPVPPVLGVLLLRARRQLRALTARVSDLETTLFADAALSPPSATAPALGLATTPAATTAATTTRPPSAHPPAVPAERASAAETMATGSPRPSDLPAGKAMPDESPASPAPDQPVPARSPAGTERVMFESGRGPDPAGPPWIDALRSFLFGGNTLVRVGIILLFFGFAFFLSYAAEQGWFPIEIRLGTSAAAGVTLLAIGWRLRDVRREYALALQGGGAGIVYLAAFAAVSFYDVIPAGVGLAVMLVLVGLTAALAVSQDAPSLAVLSSLGGFLGPVLVTRDASHVALFSYYAILDAGIVTVAWFRAWRQLNVLGFVFTFLVGAWWGAAFYEPQYFATMQPFLGLFVALFVAAPVLHAWRQPPRLAGFVDGTLVFGVPLAAYTLQHRLASGFEYGPAISALAFCGLYAVLAGLISGRGRESLRLLVESFVALSVVFGTLAIPLAVDGSWTAGAWALEGAAIVWIGVRHHRRPVLLAGLGLQLLAGCFAVYGQSSSELPGLNMVYLGRLVVSLSGLVSAWFLRRPGLPGLDSRPVSRVALAWGLIWWFGAGVNEISRHLSGLDQDSATLGFLAITAAALALMRSRLHWKDLAYPPMLLLPAMVLLTIDWLSTTPDLLAGWGAFAWPAAFLMQYWVLWRCETEWSTAAPWYHCGTLWLGVFLVWREVVWIAGQIPAADGSAWPFAVPALVPTFFLLALMTFGTLLRWPFERFRQVYVGIGPLPLAIAAAGWVLVASFHRGDPHPLPYVPLLNPVEFVQVFTLSVLVQWSLADAGRGSSETRWRMLGFFSFATLNGVLARATHYFRGVPFEPGALLSSGEFQALLSVVWTTVALITMLVATRVGCRPEWRLGAVLLTATVIKLFLFDLSDTGTLTRIVSFMVVGGLILVIGYVSPLPPEDARSKSG